MSRQQQSEFRQHLTDVVAEDTGFSKVRSKELVNFMLSEIVGFVKSHEATEIRGFGSFRWVQRKPRRFSGGIFGNRTIPGYMHLCFRSKLTKED